MSAATSPGTGLAYGLRRVCAAWGMARSSFYAMTSGQHAEQPPAKRRGPKPAISDQALLVAIEADLEASPWEGEGYRKVWARLRVCRDIRVARKRVLRLMRENNLLSPHRCCRRGGNPHDGEIITHAPNLMWGTDGVRVFTVDDGWGWIFTAVEHWNAECVGWHVCKPWSHLPQHRGAAGRRPLAERGIDVSNETVRRWFLKFGRLISGNLRRSRPRASARWHLDEMVIRIRGRRHWLWRAVDDEGEVLDFLVQPRRCPDRRRGCCGSC